MKPKTPKKRHRHRDGGSVSDEERTNKIKDAIDLLNSCLHENVRDRDGQGKPAKYVWMVVGGPNPCDIRRYAYSHREAVLQLSHIRKSKYRDCYYTHGTWELFKLVKVNKRKVKQEAIRTRKEGESK